ncbi:hypothetical protein ACT8ZV_04740 [Nocardioides sp. MAHUQ-72]|uniref:hypothetical protein n=1 Tax=unclassified Nocardioides TaxID=2615069 RepID=UPI000B1A2C7A
MSDQLTTNPDLDVSKAMTTSETTTPAGGPVLLQVLRDQRKTIGVAVVLCVASYWIAGQLDRWTLAGCISTGVLLGLVNHLATEMWLLKTIRSGEEVTRGKLAAATFVRLLVLTVVAVGIAVAFWPDGIGLLLGLAIFRLIALVMTTIPLLKELKKP